MWPPAAVCRPSWGLDPSAFTRDAGLPAWWLPFGPQLQPSSRPLGPGCGAFLLASARVFAAFMAALAPLARSRASSFRAFLSLLRMSFAGKQFYNILLKDSIMLYN